MVDKVDEYERAQAEHFRRKKAEGQKGLPMEGQNGLPMNETESLVTGDADPTLYLDYLKSIGQGATSGFSDEMFGEGFLPVKPRIGGEILGSLLLGGGVGAGARFLPRFVSNIPRWAKYMGLGAAGGGAAGLGYSEDKTMDDLTRGAKFGAGVGLIAPPIVRGLGRGAMGVGRAFGGLLPPSVSANREIRRRMQEDMLDPEAINRGVDYPYVEGGVNVRDLAGAVARTDPGPYVGQIRKQGSGQKDRILDVVKEHFGEEGGAKDISMIINEAKEQARPLYEIAKTAEYPVKGPLAALLRRNVVQKSVKEAKLAAEDVDDFSLTEHLDEFASAWTPEKGFEYKGSLTGEVMHYIKLGLDRVIRRNTDDVTGKMKPEGLSANRAKDQLLGIMDARSPDYKEARKFYSDFHLVKEAQDRGRKIFRSDYDVEEMWLANISNAERISYLKGVSRALNDEIAKKGANVDVTRIFSDHKLKSLKNLFSNKDDYKRFVSSLQKEAKTKAATNELLAGSQTAQRQVADRGLMDDLPTSVSSMTNKLLKAISNIFGAGTQSVEVRKQIARKLLSDEPGNMEDFIKLAEQASKQSPDATKYLGLPSVFATGSYAGSGERSEE